MTLGNGRSVKWSLTVKRVRVRVHWNTTVRLPRGRWVPFGWQFSHYDGLGWLAVGPVYLSWRWRP